ncbi:hypothetical protein FACS189476_01210 [Spirochaetia bacterium]|nr:hypothetical protein FACS189476_01210 [Spirochaetia bacterium]
MSDIKIFVSHRIDLESEVVGGPLYYPVRYGAVFDKENKSGLPGDDTGDNISEKRLLYNELTVQYWAWKNVDADYYGLCHYRRYLSLSEETYAEDGELSSVSCSFLDDEIQGKFCLNEDGKTRIEQYDFIVGAPFNVKFAGTESVYEQYVKSPYHYAKDIDCVKEIIETKYPQYVSVMEEYFNENILYPCNLFIMKKELFREYCAWLFDILFEFEKRTDTSKYSRGSLRNAGHLGERLLGIFYLYTKRTSTYRFGEFQRVLVSNPEKRIVLHPFFESNNVPVVLASSEYFVPYAAVALQSILDTMSSDTNYDIIFLHVDISPAAQKRLRSFTSDIYSNVSLRFYNVSKDVADTNFAVNAHLALQTFFRLYLQKIGRHYERILFIDCDVIVKTDIADLYRVDIGDNLIGAALDPDHTGQYASIPEVKTYTDTVLELNDPYSYFQAGVLLFNIAEFNKRFVENEIVDIAQKRECMFCAQDVLNMVCKGSIYFFDMAWNVITDCGGPRMDTILRSPNSVYDAYMKARQNPKIIHYAGNLKPWDKPESDFADEFWKAARKSLFYEVIVKRVSDSNIETVTAHAVAEINERIDGIYLGRLVRKSVKFRLNKLVTVFFPKGTKRREKLKKSYYKLRGWKYI